MLSTLMLATVGLQTLHLPDNDRLTDPMRPVSEITRTSFTLQYYTSEPCETRVQVREGEIPMTVWRPARREFDPWGARHTVAHGEPGKRTWHQVTVKGLQPGKRYHYRIWDPGANPTSQEKTWGAGNGWRREFAVSTLAPKGRKSIIHLPVKVLLMPNVIHVATAHDANGSIAPTPPKATPEQIQKIKDEFAVSSRFFWVNSGMRLWVDYQIVLDERWQRWGEEVPNTGDFYKGWPASRSWAGVDYASPGGGAFTIVDMRDPHRVTKQPVFEEKPYSSQVEMAWLRRWNKAKKEWEFVNSGGGTYGVDGFPSGFPGRSQFLGGGDTAWLATHEVHHSLESHGAFSLSNREDERIVFNHYAARRRDTKPDGSFEENTWSTSGRHGEHWDGMAFWDRTLSDAQWLRFYFGYTITVADADGDGFPDNDPRLPLDERRFGSSPSRAKTDGRISDLAKVMLSTWVPGPLQSSWAKPEPQWFSPNPTSPDSDGDGIPDEEDPYPLYPWRPIIVPISASVDGDPDDWSDVPLAGEMSREGIRLTFKHGHSEAAYAGLIRISGPWQRVVATFDGEGLGVYSGQGVVGFEVHRTADGAEAKPSFVPMKGMIWKSSRRGDETIFEFSLPNRGDGPWFWDRGGREIGVVLNVADDQGRLFSVYEPYRPFYARMLEPHGVAPVPKGAPSELVPGPGVVSLKGDDLAARAPGWERQGAAVAYSGGDERLIVIPFEAKEFDLWVEIEAASDAVLGAFLPATKDPNAGRDYIGFVGGYGNTVTKLRLFGRERGEGPQVMIPGRHRVQLSRRSGSVWLLLDGKAVAWAADPNPGATVDRLAVIGGYGGKQKVHEVRYR